MRLWVCVIVGRWKLEGFRLYREREHCSVRNPSNRWRSWDRVL